MWTRKKYLDTSGLEIHKGFPFQDGDEKKIWPKCYGRAIASIDWTIGYKAEIYTTSLAMASIYDFGILRNELIGPPGPKLCVATKIT